MEERTVIGPALVETLCSVDDAEAQICLIIPRDPLAARGRTFESFVVMTALLKYLIKQNSSVPSR
jgi:hypothetical protein